MDEKWACHKLYLLSFPLTHELICILSSLNNVSKMSQCRAEFNNMSKCNLSKPRGL